VTCRRRGNAPGFSMVEILVVVGILSILAALLVPSGLNLLQASRKTLCLGNFKTLHSGLVQYASDHGGFYPSPMENALPAGGSGSWTMALMMGDYVGVRAVSANVKNPFLCPEARRTYSDGQARRTYGMNTLPSTITQAVSVYRLKSPAQTILLADCIQSADLGEHDAIFYFRSSSLDRVEDRHGGMFQGLFADGHVELLKKSDPRTAQYIDNLAQ